MAEHGFTRGPWVFTTDGIGDPVIRTKWGGNVISAAWLGGSQTELRISDDDARLVIAAPELYAALQGMVAAYGNQLATCPYTRLARDALAKAVGE